MIAVMKNHKERSQMILMRRVNIIAIQKDQAVEKNEHPSQKERKRILNLQKIAEESEKIPLPLIDQIMKVMMKVKKVERRRSQKRKGNIERSNHIVILNLEVEIRKVRRVRRVRRKRMNQLK